MLATASAADHTFKHQATHGAQVAKTGQQSGETPAGTLSSHEGCLLISREMMTTGFALPFTLDASQSTCKVCVAAMQREARQPTPWLWQLRGPSLAGGIRPRSLRRPSSGPSSCSTARTACRPPLLVHHQFSPLVCTVNNVLVSSHTTA